MLGDRYLRPVRVVHRMRCANRDCPVSSARGIALQRALAVYLRPWWPAARPAERGRSEPDVLNTPGVVWENKTPRRFDPFAWAKQAAGYIKAGNPGVPITVYWPDGVGQQRPEMALAIVPLPIMMALLEMSKIAPEPGTSREGFETFRAPHPREAPF